MGTNAERRDDSKMEVSLEQVLAAESLDQLNGFLTQAMAAMRAQALLKDEGLSTITDAITALALESSSSAELLAASMLGRIAAVARGREEQVHAEISSLFTEEPVSVETLADGDAKTYAAEMLRYVDADWLVDYCMREAILIDTAEKARSELLTISLERLDNVSAWYLKACENLESLRQIENVESRMKRVRRITGCMQEIVRYWGGDPGDEPGVALSQFAEGILGTSLSHAENATLFGVTDNVLGMLERIVQLRFSLAMTASTYAAVSELKRRIGLARWGEFLKTSQVLKGIRVALLEAGLVLARQNRMDRDIVIVLKCVYGSPGAVANAVMAHFEHAQDLDPEVSQWWVKAGEVAGKTRKVEHAVGSTEDEQIGALLIAVEDNHELMERVGRAVVPFLSISDPVLADTVERATNGYESMAQIARRLARMRKLTKTELVGQQLEFNPLEHDLVGARAGVRHVKVVRDGIKKEFGGKIRTLVKPRVEPVK